MPTFKILSKPILMIIMIIIMTTMIMIMMISLMIIVIEITIMMIIIIITMIIITIIIIVITIIIIVEASWQSRAVASEEASNLRKAVTAGELRSCTWHPHVDAVLGVATETTSSVEAAFVLRCQHRRLCGATLVDIIR